MEELEQEEDRELELVEVGMLHIRIVNLHRGLKELGVRCNLSSQCWD
jgi:hypothetical protein